MLKYFVKVAFEIRKREVHLCKQSCAANQSCTKQGLTGRLFQLRVGSGLCIGKNYRVGSGLGSGSGIGNIY